MCPHKAIQIRRRVEIDEVDCTGCGLCVRACPSQALEARVRIRPAPALKCSQVGGDAPSIHCLGRLGASDLLRLAGSRNQATLARGDCGECPIGTEATILAVEQEIDRAEELARTCDREIDIELSHVDRLDRSLDPARLNRRELFRGGWRELQEGAAQALAPLDPRGREQR